MTPAIQGFNKAFSDILKNSPNSDSSELIKKIEQKYVHSKDYYSIMDSIAHKAGFGIIAVPILDKNDKELGYQPNIKYYPENLLKEPPRTEILVTNNFMPLGKCYEYLAKEMLYRLVRIRNIESLI